jgi:hypothetical protein
MHVTITVCVHACKQKFAEALMHNVMRTGMGAVRNFDRNLSLNNEIAGTPRTYSQLMPYSVVRDA